MSNKLDLRGAIACDPRVPDIIEQFGKRYIWTPVPKGLPRFRTIGACHANSTMAAYMDGRLTYVEGLSRAPSTGLLVGHAWVTMEGVHAIDLTWRGQSVRGSRRQKEAIRRFGQKADPDHRMDPATEYYGVEIPTRELARLVWAQRAFGLVLDQYITAEAA